MRVLVEIRLDATALREKMDELRKRLDMIVSTVDASTPQVNKNRRIKSLVSITQRLIDEMGTAEIGVAKCREVENG